MSPLLRCVACLAALALAPLPLHAKETVVDVGDSFTCHFQNAGDTGLAHTDLGGSSNKDWTEEEIAAIRRALEAWDDAITQAPLRRVTVGFYWMDFAAKGRGGSMGGSTVQLVPPGGMSPGGQQIFTRPERVWRDGVEVKGAASGYDILICFNSRPGLFYFGKKAGSAIGGAHDFQSVVMHEVGHGLGITSAVRGARQGQAVFQTAGNTMLFTCYDGLMYNAKGERVVEKAVQNMAQAGLASSFKTGEEISIKGSPLTIYNPPQFKAGSSVTHVDKDDALMQHSFAPGSFHRKISKEELGLMELMGWQVKGAAASKDDGDKKAKGGKKPKKDKKEKKSKRQR